MTGAPSDTGYIIFDRAQAEAETHAHVDAVTTQLLRKGWKQVWDVGQISILVGPRRRLKVSLVGPRHLLVGDWRPHGQRTVSALVGLHRDPFELSKAVTSEGWGAYILVWRADDGGLRLLRDPSGAIDCIHWRRDGLAVVSNQWPVEADALLPHDVEIDWDRLARMMEHSQYSVRHVALRGVRTVDAGGLADLKRSTETAIWRPGDVYGRRYDVNPEALVEVVDRTISALTSGASSVIAELSGGLDSAIAVGSLLQVMPRSRVQLVNYYGPWSEGDERIYAGAAADLFRHGFVEAAKPVRAVLASELSKLGHGVRPAFQGVDTTYDADMAARLSRHRAVSMTGQGGDAVFFQQATPWIATDRFRRGDPGALHPGYLARVGRWTRRSAWAVANAALSRTSPNETSRGVDVHPWFRGLDRIPPGKRLQIHQLANCQVFWRDCLRSRAAPLLHPFLSQPVMEHCLAVPTDILALGERDRGFARQAFSSRLPRLIQERRNKGDLTRYYGRINQLSIPMLRAHLLKGRLAEAGVIDRDEFSAILSDERLIWDGQHNRIMLPAILESWARHWQARLRGR
jgi:asparagine synthase (glutamine-hydrolysing)